MVWLRGDEGDREAEAPEIELLVVAIPFVALAWGGRGNVLAAAGVALLNMVESADAEPCCGLSR